MSCSQNNELLTYSEAYHSLWGAGSIALEQLKGAPETAVIIGDVVLDLFNHLDNHQAHSLNDHEATPGHITLSALLKPIKDEMKQRQAQEHAVNIDEKFKKRYQDERLDALYAIDIFVRVARKRVQESKLT